MIVFLCFSIWSPTYFFFSWKCQALIFACVDVIQSCPIPSEGMLSHISITVFIFRDMSRDLAKSNFHINVLQGEGKLLPTDWQVDDGIPPPQPLPLFKPLAHCSFSLPSSVLRVSFLSTMHQRSTEVVDKFVISYLLSSSREDFQVKSQLYKTIQT